MRKLLLLVLLLAACRYETPRETYRREVGYDPACKNEHAECLRRLDEGWVGTSSTEYARRLAAWTSSASSRARRACYYAWSDCEYGQ